MVVKSVFSEKIYIPELDKELTFNFVVAGLNEYVLLTQSQDYPDNDDNCVYSYLNYDEYIKEYIKEFPESIIEDNDLKNELKKYCPDSTTQNKYFYINTYHNNELMPIHYCLYLQSRKFVNFGLNPSKDWNKQVAQYFKDVISKQIRFMILEYSVNSKDIIYYDNSSFDYHQYQILSCFTENYDAEDCLTISEINNVMVAIKTNKILPIKYYLYALYQEYCSIMLENKMLLVCEYCGFFMKYKKGKKYCSLKSENKDCGKSARNKRQYNQKKQKPLLNSN